MSQIPQIYKNIYSIYIYRTYICNINIYTVYIGPMYVTLKRQYVLKLKFFTKLSIIISTTKRKERGCNFI